MGYSGNSDPVFEHLASVDEFGFGLYWVGFKDNDPVEDVRFRLLDPELHKKAFYTKGYDADDFFDALIRALNIYPPKLVAQPFTHLNEFLNRVTPEERFKDTREMIEKAIEQFEQITVRVRGNEGERGLSFIEDAQQLMNGGDYDSVIRLRHKYDGAPSLKGADYLSRAYMMKGKRVC